MFPPADVAETRIPGGSAKGGYTLPPGNHEYPFKVKEWEEINMDFIVVLPHTRDGYDSIWVIVDRLTKVAHFIPVNTTYT